MWRSVVYYCSDATTRRQQWKVARNQRETAWSMATDAGARPTATGTAARKDTRSGLAEVTDGEVQGQKRQRQGRRRGRRCPRTTAASTWKEQGVRRGERSSRRLVRVWEWGEHTTHCSFIGSLIKLGLMVFNCLHNQAPQYLIDFCQSVSSVASRQHLRSANRRLLVVPRYRLSSYGRRAFSVAGPAIWNWLPDSLRDPAISRDSFRFSLKTFLFSAYLCT